MILDNATLGTVVKKLHKSLRSLFEDLVSSGWEISEASSGPMGEVIVTLQRDEVRIRLFHEKGYPAVEAGPIPWGATYAASTWREHLTGEEVDAQTPVEIQADLLRSDLSAIMSAIASGTVDQSTLRGIATRQRWAIPGWPD